MAEGLFVVFEGPEGSGKSTQIELLSRRLSAMGTLPLLTREPGGTPAGDAIRRVLLDVSLDIEPLTEFLLLAASRAQHTRDVIRPALEAGRLVICDRYTGASVAYQGYGRGLAPAVIGNVNELATGGLKAHLTVLLDIEPAQGLLRVLERGGRDRLESADIEFHRRVREGFLRQAEQDDTWVVFDALLPERELAARIWSVVEKRLTQ